MSVESIKEIPFKIRAGTEIQLTVTPEGNFIIPPHDLPARILPASEQTRPSLIEASMVAVQYLYKDPKNEKLQYYENAFLPFPEKYRPRLLDILQKLEKLNFPPDSSPTPKVRMELLSDAQTAIFELERELPKAENSINPVIFGLKAGFSEYLKNPVFDPF